MKDLTTTSTPLPPSLANSKGAELSILDIFNAPARMAEWERKEMEELASATELTTWQAERLAELKAIEAADAARPIALRSLVELRLKDADKAVKGVAMLLAEIQQEVGARNMMDGAALATAAADIVNDERFCWLTTADLQVVRKMARMGDFGETYERINEATLIKWLKAYIDKRIAMADDINYHKHCEATKNATKLTKEELANLYKAFAATPLKTVAPLTNEERKAIAAEQRREVAMLFGDAGAQETG